MLIRNLCIIAMAAGLLRPEAGLCAGAGKPEKTDKPSPMQADGEKAKGIDDQPPPDQTPPKSLEELKKEKTAELHFNRGVDFFQDGMTSAALAEFLKSYKIYPQWAVLYNVGVCFYRLGKYDEALKALDTYMDEGGENIPPERRFAVEKLRIKMAASYGSIVIDYKLPGVRLIIDGSQTYKTPIKDPIPVAAGIHTIYMYREGHYPVLVEVAVASGEELIVPVKMDLTPLMEAWLTDTQRLDVLGLRKKISKLEVATWSLLGASGALAIATIAAGSVTYKMKQDQTSALFECGGPITSEQDCPEAFDIEDRGGRWMWATNGLIAATGVMLLAALSVWIVKKVKMKKLLEEGSPDLEDDSRISFNVTGPGSFTIAW